MTAARSATTLDRLSAVAAAGPDHVALVDGARRVTYSDLLEAGRAVAALIPSDTGPLVGIGMERSWRAVAAMVGILLSGRAYVPIDLSYPQARRRHIVADARLTHVVTDGDGSGPGVEVVDAVPTPEHDVPSDAMYVIYTSGSTGAPKGVVVRHGNVLSLLDATAEALPIADGLRWSVFHSLSFDFSVWEVWGPLLSGGTAVLVAREVAVDPALTSELLRAERVQVLSMVPSGFTGLVGSAVRTGHAFPDLRAVVFGGEAVRLGDVEQWWRAGLGPDCALINMYGITETTVHVTECVLTPAIVAASTPGRTPIGQPLPNATIRLTPDGGVTTSAVGESGEIMVSGAGVAAGYLGRPELTAERFPVVDGQPSYRSGDWAVQAEDGSLVYVGRTDEQVKIRGHRIELGEIEGMLARHPDVAAAACVVHRDGERPERLVAFVVGRDGPIDARAVRSWLATQVPAHLVPMRILDLDLLPTTASGKADRKALGVAAAELFRGSTRR